MDLQSLASLVGSLGFPIVCCGALFWYQSKTMKDFTDEIKVTLKELSESINQNTDATTKLVTTVELLNKIGGDKM